MFFEGDLQSGISYAITQQKLVICFLSDDGNESSEWESLLLQDPKLTLQFDEKAVLLRIETGSQEAGFLSAFCPIDSAPSLVVIRNGTLFQHLKAPLPSSELKLKLLAAFGDQTNPSTTTVESVPQQGSPSTHDSRTSNIDTIPKSSVDKGKGKAKETVHEQKTDQVAPTTVNTEKSKRQEELRQRRKEAEQERKRVLEQIENDKRERKERERIRKAVAQQEGPNEHEHIRTTSSRQTLSAECALKVRAFDGSTISETFPSYKSLRADVRPWVESSLGTLDSPYEFKQVQVPLPNRRIEVSEEEETLQALGLTPSATLVMVPVESYSTAYGARQGYISTGLSYGYGMIGSGLGLCGGIVRSMLGGSQSNPTEESQRSSETYDGARDEPRSSSIRIRTLRDQRGVKDDQQLYNGNQLNFEPRRQEDSDDEH